MFASWQIEDLVDLVRRRYPEWDGFDHSPFVADEIAPKQATVAKAADQLSRAEVEALLAGWRYDEFLTRLERLGKDNNLLWNRVPSRGDLAILFRPSLDKAEFGLQMQRLLYGRGSTTSRLQTFSRYAAANYLPNKWTFPTYFLFITHPATELFVKPQVAHWFLKFLGLGQVYSPTPNKETYGALRQQGHDLQDALQMYKPRDMVDIQSFLWICARESDTRLGGLDMEGQVELDVPAAYAPAELTTLLRESAEEEVELPTVGELLEPLFQAFKLLHGAGSVAQLEATVVYIAGLSPAQRLVLQKPGQSKQTKLAYRLAWARTRLKNRGLIESTERGFWQLTEKGVDTDFAEDASLARQIQERQGAEESAATVLREPGISYEPYPLAHLAEETGYEEADLARWVQALRRKQQAILYGPPGTGKTFLAQKLAQHLVGGSDGFVDLVQFHPAYSYEDFIQGIRPITGPDGALRYEMVAGRFLQFCEEARQRQGNCVLIVDEINRANLSHVFGELMYLLEYRDRRIPLAGGGTFEIPANVYLLGTMNTADRSIALVDHALRRRFAFVALEPNYEILRHYHRQHETGFPVEKLIRLLQWLNRQIGDPHYAVGITFFLRPDLAQQLPNVWQTEIEPYLEEYFFDRPEQVDAFRWEQIRRELQDRES